MGSCSSRPVVSGEAKKELKPTVTFQDNADHIRAFKSAHHADDGGGMQQLADTALESFKSRAASFASSVSEGGIAGEAFGDALGAVLRDASPGTGKQSRSSKRRTKQQKKAEAEALPPGATASPRHSQNGVTHSKPTAASQLPPQVPMSQRPSLERVSPAALLSVDDGTESSPSPSAEDLSSRAKSAPQQEDGESTPQDQATRERQRRPTVTFEPQAVSDPATRVIVRERNKSRLKVASQPGQTIPDSPPATSPMSAPDSIGSQKSVNRKSHRGPPPPVLPMHPQLPAAKGGAAEPGLWVLRRTGNVRHKYILADALGRGQFGAVCVAMDRTTGERWACKSVSKRRVQGMHDFSMTDVLREVEVLYTVGGHPGVVGLREVYEDEEDLHLILELCQGGDWFERLINFGRYTEAEAAVTIRSMLEALSYCHSLGVMHRDIKPENIMFVDRTESSAVKLTDFGLAALFTEGGPMLSEVLGSAYYVAPEVLREAYSKEADIWSTGIVLFIALGGYAPFDGANEREVFFKILHEPLEFKDSSWSHISQDAKDVILSMLTKDPKSRGTIKELLAHPWFSTCAGTVTPEQLSSQPLPKVSNGAASAGQKASGSVALDSSLTQRMPKGSIARAVATAVKKGKVVRSVPDAVVARLQQFSAMNAFKRQARRVLATYLPEEEVVGLMQVFKDMDRDGDGLLTMRELQEGLADRGVHITDINAKLLLQRADLDGDGAVDYGEFLAATLHLARLERDERLYRAFRFFDKDGSGFITRDELESGLQHLGRVNVERILAEVDKDGDGRICYTEFCDMLRHDAEPGMAAVFAESSIDGAPFWGAWGEGTESGRLMLAMPQDSGANSRQMSLANSRNASCNDRTSYASMGATSSGTNGGVGAVSIRRSLGGNLLFGSRNARASGTGGVAHRPSLAGRPSLGGNRALSLAGSSRFGSMRNAALMAAAASDSSGRSSVRTMASNDEGFHSHGAGLSSHRSAGAALQPYAGVHGHFDHASTVHATAQRLHDATLEAVTEVDSGSLDPSTPVITPVPSILGPQPRPDALPPIHAHKPPPVPRAVTEGGHGERHPPSPFSVQTPAAPHPTPPLATPTAWADPASSSQTPAAPRMSPRHLQQRQKPAAVRPGTEGDMIAAAAKRVQQQMATSNDTYNRTSTKEAQVASTPDSPDSGLWRQVREVGAPGITDATSSPLGPRPAAHNASVAAHVASEADDEELAATRRTQSCMAAPAPKTRK